MNISLHPYQLEFLFPFRIAHGMRTHTDALFIEIHADGVSAFGEATFPPYLPYGREEAMAFISRLDLRHTALSFHPEVVMAEIRVDHPDVCNPPAFAALDMALWTLRAKLDGTSVRALMGIEEYAGLSPPRTYTIAVCAREEMALRIAHGRANGFSCFKLKLDGRSDMQMLTDFRALTDAPFAADANQAWTDTGYATEMAQEMERCGCILIEQPFHRSDRRHTAALSAAISIPIIADEACQTAEDIPGLNGHFAGINVKLQKCGGLSPALRMIGHARSLGLKILIGCMSESAVGCGTAEHLAPLCDWNDLDGPWLVKPVPYSN